jgi:hypothetical protein
MYAVLDKDGNPWGPFDNAMKAGAWANAKWPTQPHNDPRWPPHREGWNIIAIRPAD